MALLYRRTSGGYELAGVMFTAPIASSMDELDVFGWMVHVPAF